MLEAMKREVILLPKNGMQKGYHKERATTEVHMVLKNKLMSCYTCIYNCSLGSVFPICLFYEVLNEIYHYEATWNRAQPLWMQAMLELPRGAPRWASVPVPAGNSSGNEGRASSEKSPWKDPTSSQLSGTLTALSELTQLLLWIRSKASLTKVMGKLILLGWGDRGAYCEAMWSLSQDTCSQVNWCCL